MPWFPDFASAVELARRQTPAAGLADPVGEVRSRKEVRRFVSRNLSWLSGLHARTERVATTARLPGRE